MEAVKLGGVTKTFGQHTAVDRLSLSVPRGSIYGFIGPNGSGKTTTLRMIMSILLPDSGEIQVLGEMGSPRVRDRVAYLPEERGLYKKMKVRQLLRYYGRLKGARAAELEPRIDRLLDQLDLRSWQNRKVEALSKGMAQKLQIIAAIVSEPELLILDEPFSGLDPVNTEALKEVITALRKNGATVIFSTHDMATAETMCDRIFMIFEGQKVLDGTLDEIQAAHGQDIVRVRTDGGKQLLEEMDEVESISDLGRHQDVTLKGDPQEFLHRLVARTRIHHFELVRPSLHDIFVRIARPQTNNGSPRQEAGA